MLDLRVVMACGHVSSARYTTEDGEKIPVCPQCLQTNPEQARKVVSLKGRIAKCRFCNTPSVSTPDLFDFQYNPKGATDSYYDGCKGW